MVLILHFLWLQDWGTYMKSSRLKTTMDAAVLTGPRKIRVDQVEIPVPGRGDVRIRLGGSGVCASNLALWEGVSWAKYPLEPGALGHEGWGTIDEIGDGVTDLKVGDHVTFLSYHAYAEYDIAKADAVIKLPEVLRKKVFPGEALGCAMNIFRRCEIAPGQTVAIVGIGFLGALLTRLATNAGASVIAISRRPFALKVARSMGAAETILMEDHYRIIDTVQEITENKLCDHVIEAVGKQWPLDLCAELTKERGRLVIAGYHQDGPRQVNMQLWNWRGLDVINAHERDSKVYLEGMRAAMDAISSGLFDPSPLFTHVYPLKQLGEALDATLHRPEGFLKAVVTFD